MLRRLARAAPEVLERVKAGEFKSVRVAAIEAGIIKPVSTIRLVDGPAKVATAIARHCTANRIHAICEALLAARPALES